MNYNKTKKTAFILFTLFLAATAMAKPNIIGNYEGKNEKGEWISAHVKEQNKKYSIVINTEDLQNHAIPIEYDPAAKVFKGTFAQKCKTPGCKSIESVDLQISFNDHRITSKPKLTFNFNGLIQEDYMNFSEQISDSAEMDWKSN